MEKINISFEDGYKEYEINGDKNRILRFNPSDFSIVEKVRNYQSDMEKLRDKYKDAKNDIDIIESTRKDVEKIVDTIFYEGACKIIFGDVHPLSVIKTKNGESVVLVNFFEAITKEIKKEVGKQEQSQEKKKEAYRENVRAITSKRNHK